MALNDGEHVCAVCSGNIAQNFAEASIVHHPSYHCPPSPIPAIAPFKSALGLEIAQLMSWRHSFLIHLLVPIENPS